MSQQGLQNECCSEQTLDLQHHLFSLTFGGKLYTAPIPKDQKLHRVLDVGTGTGIWAIDFGKYCKAALLRSKLLLIDLQPMTTPNLR
jgi:ubiquinone/menaquinone biosynthesis C-methylase UbiE